MAGECAENIYICEAKKNNMRITETDENGEKKCAVTPEVTTANKQL